MQRLDLILGRFMTSALSRRCLAACGFGQVRCGEPEPVRPKPIADFRLEATRGMWLHLPCLSSLHNSYQICMCGYVCLYNVC